MSLWLTHDGKAFSSCRPCGATGSMLPRLAVAVWVSLPPGLGTAPRPPPQCSSSTSQPEASLSALLVEAAPCSLQPQPLQTLQHVPSTRRNAHHEGQPDIHQPVGFVQLCTSWCRGRDAGVVCWKGKEVQAVSS